MAMASLSTVSRWPSASLSILTGTTRRTTAFQSVGVTNNRTRSGLLHCSFIPSSSSSLSFPSSFSGLSLGLDFNCSIGIRRDKSRGLVVTAAGRSALGLTKRNRSRKSLARTHGFRLRMRTTSGRATLKRRRAKGRKVLCTKSYPNRGPGS